MTEEVIDSQANSAESILNKNETVAEVSPQVEVRQSAEKMLSQSEVNDIVGRVRAEARDNVIKNISLNQQQPVNNAPPEVGRNNFSEGQIRGFIAEEAAKKSTVDEDNRVANQFVAKLHEAKAKYEDFDQTAQDLQIGKVPMNIIRVLNTVDNIGDVLHDISNRFPEKFTEIINTASWSPELAKKALSKISKSIKVNDEAKKGNVSPPLSQDKPTISSADNGNLTIRDLKKQPWLRG